MDIKYKMFASRQNGGNDEQGRTTGRFKETGSILGAV